MSEMLLFSPLSIRGIELRNRIVVPPKQQNSVAGIQLGHSGRKARAKRPELADGCCLEIGHRGSVPPQFGYWLGTRAKRGFGTRPSTWQNGLKDTGNVL